MIKVLIVDDQDLMLQGLSMIVGKEEQLEVVGLCHNGQEAVDFCLNEETDIVLMDIRMPILNGVEATKAIMALNKKIKVIILTTFNDDDYIFSSLLNGASGYLLKDARPEEITGAINKVYEGGTLINPEVATKLVSAIREDKIESKTDLVQDNKLHPMLKDLTRRENDICHLLAEGKNNREIGQELIISEGTVKNNITRILTKLDMRDRTQLALFAMKYKI